MPAALLALQLLAAAPAFEARAPARLPATEAPDPDTAAWYGWQPLLTDATAAVFFGGAWWTGTQRDFAVASPFLIAGGLGLYVFGGPGLHLLRDRPRAALIDLGVRVGFPLGGLLGGGVLALLSQQGGWVTVGFGVGVLAAVVTDIVGVSWEPPPQGSAGPARVEWTPFIGASNGGAVAGLAGVF